MRRWFVKEFPPVIRERVMTFVDSRTARPIAHVEIVIHRPELAKALKRHVLSESDRMGDGLSVCRI